ncbi:MAG: metallophosphoesterase [Cyanobacteria bacterium P01_A01_bin.137]
MGTRELNFRFAVVSDLHIALPHTIWDSPKRFHLVEVSIPAFEQILTTLEQQGLDFLLLPGDLVQHGERDNHQWLVERLARLPFPTYVVPGNHDVLMRQGQVLEDHMGRRETVSLNEFTHLYQPHGYSTPDQPYYHHEILDGVHLIGLNSNGFDPQGQQFYTGWLDPAQLQWLDTQLDHLAGQFILVMLHHNALEHLPGQARSKVGKRYMVKNAKSLTQRLKAAGVPLMFTGHIHIQDIARSGPLTEITTGSLVSYPHPYRTLSMTTDDRGQHLAIQSHRIESVPDFPTLQASSHSWMEERSFPFMARLLMDPPLGLSEAEAQQYAPILKNFWSAIAAGDAIFDYPELPAPLRQHFQRFSALDTNGQPQLIDNTAVLAL